MENSKAKVLHLNTRFLGVGASGAIATLLGGLSPERYELHLAVGRETCGLDAIKKRLPCHVKLHQLPRLVRPIRPHLDAASFFDVKRLLTRERFDIVHTHTPKAGVLGRLAAHQCGVPCIIHSLRGTSFHDGQPWAVRLAFILAERLAASRTHRILSVGSEIRDKYLDHGIGMHGQYEIVRTGLDLSPFMESEPETGAIKQELGIPAEAALILSVGRLDPSKGFEYAIKVVAGLKARNIEAHLLIAGEGAHAGVLGETALKMGVGERLHLLGFRNDVHRLMRACDIFLFTSIREGLPQVLVQAAASGMPIITHAVEGAREVIEDGETGYVITIGDMEAALERAILILDNPESAKAMADRARNAVKDQWSPIRMIAHTDAIYQDLLANWRNIK